MSTSISVSGGLAKGSGINQENWFSVETNWLLVL